MLGWTSSCRIPEAWPSRHPASHQPREDVLELVGANVEPLHHVAVEHGRGHGAASPLALELVQRVEDDALGSGESVSHVGDVVAWVAAWHSRGLLVREPMPAASGVANPPRLGSECEAHRNEPWRTARSTTASARRKAPYARPCRDVFPRRRWRGCSRTRSGVPRAASCWCAVAPSPRRRRSPPTWWPRRPRCPSLLPMRCSRAAPWW